MSNEELVSYVNETIGTSIKAMSVDFINQKPHAYMIGPKHVGYAANNWGGMLGGDTIAAMEKAKGPCYMVPGCSKYYSEHTSDKVLFIQLQRDLTNKEAGELFTSIKAKVEEHGIAGFVFVEHPEKFRVTQSEEGVV